MNAIKGVHTGSRLSSVILLAGPVGVGDGYGDGVPPMSPTGSPIAVGVGVGVDFFTATPLFQINFLADLVQV